MWKWIESWIGNFGHVDCDVLGHGCVDGKKHCDVTQTMMTLAMKTILLIAKKCKILENIENHKLLFVYQTLAITYFGGPIVRIQEQHKKKNNTLTNRKRYFFQQIFFHFGLVYCYKVSLDPIIFNIFLFAKVAGQKYAIELVLEYFLLFH